MRGMSEHMDNAVVLCCPSCKRVYPIEADDGPGVVIRCTDAGWSCSNCEAADHAERLRDAITSRVAAAVALDAERRLLGLEAEPEADPCVVVEGRPDAP